MPEAPDHDSPARTPVWVRRTLIVTMCAVATALLVAVATAVIPLLGGSGAPSSARAAAGPSPAAVRAAADRRWASAACTNMLDWRNEIHHDDSSLNLGFGPLARVRDALAATRRMVNQLDALGLPPAAQTSPGRAATAQLRAELQSRLQTLQRAAGQLAGGNLAAIGTLVDALGHDGAVGTGVVTELRRLLSVDLGVSLVETPACRQLVGMPV